MMDGQKTAALCGFSLAWVGRCTAPAIAGGKCEKHSAVRCCVCQRSASYECSHTGQFVCGYPLCDDCEGWVDMSKRPGDWGFMNHSHRRKLACDPVPLDGRGKPVVRVKASSHAG